MLTATARLFMLLNVPCICAGNFKFISTGHQQESCFFLLHIQDLNEHLWDGLDAFGVYSLIYSMRSTKADNMEQGR
jgi:hypothetical protein